MNEKLYYYTFAFATVPSDQGEDLSIQVDKEDLSKVKLHMTDVIIPGTSEKALADVLSRIESKARGMGFTVLPNPKPTFTKRTKKEMLAFFEKEKKAIKKYEQDLKKKKNEEKKKAQKEAEKG